MSIELDINAIISQLIIRFCERVGKTISTITQDQFSKLKVDLNIAFSEYLVRSLEKYSKMKTLLYKNEPRPLLDFYEPLQFLYNKVTIDAQDINNIFKISRYIIIDGLGGVGKSTTMKYFFLNELEKRELVPVFIELRDLNIADSNLEEIITQTLINLGFKLDTQYIKYAMDSGCFLFLFDGFDEVNQMRSSAVCHQINDFCDKYPYNHFVISSRPDYSLIAMARFTTITTLPLTKQKAINLVLKLNYGSEITTNFINDLDKTLYLSHQSFASNPLLLTIMLMTYDSYAEIPEKLHNFYANAFDTLYSRHDATKGCFKRDMRSKLSVDLFKQVLSKFCFLTYKDTKTEFEYNQARDIITYIKCKGEYERLIEDDYLEDLLNSVCILYHEGLNLRFTHRSFQEYFTALFLKDMPDEILQKRAFFLIDNTKSNTDSVLGMLYDMIPERFEMNILLPILEKLEKEIVENDRCSAIFERVLSGVSFFKYSNEKCAIIAITEDGLNKHYSMLFKYAFNYRKQNIHFLQLSQEQKHMLRLDQFNETKYTIKEIITNQKLYDIVKRTWIFDNICAISRLKVLLQDKRAKLLEEPDLL